jgi:hypothetical protein
VERLPCIYRSADLGFIPYLRDPYILRNGFPLKALEMCATGLPVVSTLMEPLVGLAEALVVARDNDAFVEAFAVTSRDVLTPSARSELTTVCSENGYDAKFRLASGLLRASTGTNQPVATRIDDLLLGFGPDAWGAACLTYQEASPHSIGRRLMLLSYSALGNSLPRSFRQRVPESVRNRLRRWVTLA